VGTVGIFSDMRDRLRIERELETAQAELRRNEQRGLLAELAGAAAHELNQPLTSIMGIAGVMQRRLGEGPDADVARRSLDTIVSEAERMAEIVRKIGRITHYETKPYVGGARILDLDASAALAEVAPDGAGPAESGPEVKG
jgi:signal transduction histidine kinase